jgi:hypothetical protein
VPPRTLITVGIHSHLAQGLLKRYPEILRALEVAGASLVVFSVPSTALRGRLGE